MQITDSRSPQCHSVAGYEEEIHRRGCAGLAGAVERTCDSCLFPAARIFRCPEAGSDAIEHAQSLLLSGRSFAPCNTDIRDACPRVDALR